MKSRNCVRWGNGLIVVTAAAGVALSFVLLTACGGGDESGGGTQLSGSQVSAAGVTLSLPEGWAFLDNGDRGLVLSAQDDDLRADGPQGPRLTVEPASTAPPDPEALVSAMAGAGGQAGGRTEIVEGPDTAFVGVEEGVSIGLLEDDGGGAVIRRYVIVNVDGINVYQFVLETPEGQWDSSIATLEAVLASAEFDPSAAAVAPTESAAPTEIAPQPTPTSSSQVAQGYDTPEEALFPYVINPTVPIIECSSQEPDTTYPCHHFWGSADDGGLIYQYATDAGSSWWALVREQADGTFIVEDFAFDTAEIERTSEPPF